MVDIERSSEFPLDDEIRTRGRGSLTILLSELIKAVGDENTQFADSGYSREDTERDHRRQPLQHQQASDCAQHYQHAPSPQFQHMQPRNPHQYQHLQRQYEQHQPKEPLPAGPRTLLSSIGRQELKMKLARRQRGEPLPTIRPNDSFSAGFRKKLQARILEKERCKQNGEPYPWSPPGVSNEIQKKRHTLISRLRESIEKKKSTSPEVE
eukprot:JP435980.1.p1 GENE.JP435980.1~~JP435980.1.p1  ORF type:complete len:209 (-),score=12.24 JP435980.1:440-1066(-)